jgi:hypothetical protein
VIDYIHVVIRELWVGKNTFLTCNAHFDSHYSCTCLLSVSLYSDSFSHSHSLTYSHSLPLPNAHTYTHTVAVESYGQHLIFENKPSLLASYCAHLTVPRRISLYARLLLSVAHDLKGQQAVENIIDRNNNQGTYVYLR